MSEQQKQHGLGDFYRDQAETFFQPCEPKTAEEITAILVEHGYDPEEVGRRFEAIARDALERSPLNPLNSTERRLLLDAVIERLQAANAEWRFCQLCDGQLDDHGPDCPLPALEQFEAQHSPAHSGAAWSDGATLTIDTY